MHISGSTVDSACALPACTSNLECPDGFNCVAGVAGVAAYCAVWNFN
jgi:hypothetical protein